MDWESKAESAVGKLEAGQPMQSQSTTVEESPPKGPDVGIRVPQACDYTVHITVTVKL